MPCKPIIAAVATALAVAPVGAFGAPTVTPAPAQGADPAAPLAGDWDGELDTGALKLRLTLHVRDDAGRPVATFDSPDQNAMGLPADLTLQDGRVHLQVRGAAGAFDGALEPGGQKLEGTWSGRPLAFVRRAAGAVAPVRNRPQTPVKPYPYREEEVAYDSPAAHVRLAGTLTLPPGPGPFPAVVLVAGSGPQTRNETVLGHAIFLVLADHLTRHGIAVLRYDKRGLGQSTGDYRSATSEDFAADAEAGVAFLRTRPEIDHRRIGLVGHSEGGIVAPIVAGRDPKVAFVVLMAGSGVPGDRIIMAQAQAIAAASGAPPAAVAAGAAVQRRVLDAVMGAKDQASAAEAARKVLAEAGAPPARIDAELPALTSPWYRFFLTYDPAPALRRLRIPVLALIGSKDLQVPADQNIPALRAALKDDRRAEVEELPGLNHLFQTAGTGAPSEYGDIEETISPRALDTVTNWILNQGRR
ncbi:MAG TPA: alpha/beta hydrolase [Caulobacteraceae bacterium]|nr:alpha/beta hydrolase [Caulobacteraceae bacterium]